MEPVSRKGPNCVARSWNLRERVDETLKTVKYEGRVHPGREGGEGVLHALLELLQNGLDTR